MLQESLTFDDILLIPRFSEFSSRKDVDISSTDKTGKLTLKLPIFSSNMDSITESFMAHYMASVGGLGVLHRFMSIENNVREFKQSPKETFISIGVTEKEKERAKVLVEAGASRVCVDVAHGHSKQTGEMIKWLRQEFKENIYIMAGNVCTREGGQYLIDSGVDLIKVGIGGSGVCTTRIKTGFGCPQLEALSNCCGLSRSIVADGGIRTPGDIVKALVFSDFVMLGGMLAGTYYTPGDFDIEQGPNDTWLRFKTFRGMASKEVAEEKLGGLAEWKTAEGVSTKVLWKNEEQTGDIIQDIVGGLRSALTYGGSQNIKELQKTAKWQKITQNGIIEGTAHINRR